MDLNEKVNLKTIIFDLYKKDSDGLIKSDQINLLDQDKKELKTLSLTDNLKKLYEGLTNLFEKNVHSNNFNLSLMLTLFLQRYNYFYLTEIEWIKHCKTINKLNFKDPGTFFIEYISSFFENQIISYNLNYINILNRYKVQQWNANFYTKLISLTSDIKHGIDFQQKLLATEEMVKFLQNTKNIYSSLEGVGVESEKREFLAHSNEIKIVFQSMNQLINEIINLILKQS
ncbi:hypothetical protein SGLAD_v1c04960 [Spiroplasma gladiatoris]|uniref:Uncharacterized protein n=1 Tax=Spiroplasma gladiatoris TaxID=2143 RepID=A0A4P7AH03_9MOLU|nr:hypothetical protein [Spiroplasma gladiatoris]QBQ07695.1 hypothetical protein SGLAD_v1c04960 [Spiroplasma gladiatoris]